MNSISRFFTPKKTPASDKASVGKKNVPKASGQKTTAGGGGPSSFDSMDEAPHKDQSNVPPMPPSAFKKGKATALTEGVQLAPSPPRGKKADAAQANRAFDNHYGSAKKTDVEAAPRQAKYTFKENAVKEHIEFSRYPNEQPHIRGDVAKLYDIAMKRNEPVFFITEKGRTMVWPSGHMYRGAFERDGLKPGPVGELTLPSGHRVQAWFKNGSCYLAKDSEGVEVDPQVDKVHKFYTPNKI